MTIDLLLANLLVNHTPEEPVRFGRNKQNGDIYILLLETINYQHVFNFPFLRIPEIK